MQFIIAGAKLHELAKTILRRHPAVTKMWASSQ